MRKKPYMRRTGIVYLDKKLIQKTRTLWLRALAVDPAGTPKHPNVFLEGMVKKWIAQELKKGGK